MLHRPGEAASDDHRCVAIGAPCVLSHQQQELVCMRSAHVDCSRYRQAFASAPHRTRRRRTPAMPPVIAAALIMLAVSAVISFGFVVQRGGIDLPSRVPSPAAAVVATPATAPATTTPGTTAPGTLEPSIAATPAATSSPVATRPAPASPKPSVPTGGPSASRLAVLKPCPGQPGCYVYTVRSGDNLFSIAHWFGVPLNTVYAWNPAVKSAGIQPGTPLKIPTPTR